MENIITSQSPKFSKKMLIGVLLILILVTAIPLTLSQTGIQQIITGQAWSFSHSAVSSCPIDKSGAIITVSFRNAEPAKTSTVMNVQAKDIQTGKYIMLNNIAGGQTKTGLIVTNRANLSAGTVQFTMSWADGHSGTDTSAASYNTISNCTPPAPTPTPRPSNTPTPRISVSPSPTAKPTPTPWIKPSPTPSTKPSPSPTTKPSPSPTTKPSPTPTKIPSPTITNCPTPGDVQNVQIQCPSCTPSPNQ